ncbi:inner membrane ABC transporter permease protein yejE [Parachlamydia acanthamoebae UV-7]|jgi:peptide/nickel transport system permease protein|uniref:Oligopeptide transport system permease protein OppC n=3 Tax=Parachlamydia acanthamoebae TaxID=83552 RepID=F8L1R0_PARAV|nr:ABC transporter permease [Parachlamydia acanthamoebae]KIA77070.1 Inner membrane ABC transporter permease protein YejE [Parachlamydia acanthamoebae]CCB87216.1 inner membrane ABC transporter permease protein yejE [Parachlamydia acanthamoebae UV-7]
MDINSHYDPYWSMIWKQFKKHPMGMIGLVIVCLFLFVGIYAPLLASSKPLFVIFENTWFFPLFRYLFYPGFYTKRLDIFFNLLMFTTPFALLGLWMLRNHPKKLRCVLMAIFFIQMALFLGVAFQTSQDPGASPQNKQSSSYDWKAEVKQMNPYARLNLILRYQQRAKQHARLVKMVEAQAGEVSKSLPKITSLWNLDQENDLFILEQQQKILENSSPDSDSHQLALDKITYIRDRQKWLEAQSQKLSFQIMPLIRHFHWEEDAGGDQNLNRYIEWWELTRVNRKDLVSALIFGTRISLVVGILSVGAALLIGIPIGAFAGYYGGKVDIVVCRLLEIWESMPTFFMLLMIVAILQNKSIFLVIAIIGLFGWTTFSRYIRGEFLKQRNLSYVEACQSLGFSNGYIMFSHILPNAIPPLLTLLPFAIMGAITSEAGLSFLGLGEEGSCSWGVLMDEGRTAFPGESYLLWPPAILLTTLLIAIALVGDALRDALDPKMHR